MVRLLGFNVSRSATAAALAIATASVIGGAATSATAGTVARSSAGQAAPDTCTGTIQINSLAFTGLSPVNSGDIAGITLVAQNCTNQAQPAKVMWHGRFTGPGTSFPTGCLAFDPLVQPAGFAPQGQVTNKTFYRIFVSCAATSLQVTATVSAAAGSTIYATQTAELVIR